MRISDWSSDVCSSDLSGPLLDRVDLQIALPPAEPGWVDLPEGEPSAAVRQRVLDCRARQWRRQEITNARLGPDEIQAFCPLDQEGKKRSEEHTSELQSLMRISYAVFCLKKKKSRQR